HLVDLAHPARAHELDDRVAVAEGLAGGERAGRPGLLLVSREVAGGAVLVERLREERRQPVARGAEAAFDLGVRRTAERARHGGALSVAIGGTLHRVRCGISGGGYVRPRGASISWAAGQPD